MADTTPQTLLAAATCYQCNSPNVYTLNLLKLAMLQKLVLTANPMADTSPQTLLAAASCYQCYAANPYALKMIELGMLNLLVQNGGGGLGGAGQIVAYTGNDPNSDGVKPANINAPAIAVKPGATTYTWDPVAHTWT